ncbi:hypothetical protein PIIN_05045 [Serendipita indica DSM 11827]|uniref:Uncharacterized protein n=1 Tax=Serendipita indica (strain DSM 11827) TaxID=1109443 RepID=G4TIG6_SERID|nr:hypothetical protein PIIN_05045 [Serendipita indica DSM 11827]
MFNNQLILRALDASTSGPQRQGKPRERAASDFCLLERLPTTAVLLRDADAALEIAELRQLRYRRDESPEEVEEGSDSDESGPIEVPKAPETPTSSNRLSFFADSIRSRKLSFPFGNQQRENVPWKDPQPYEVLRAVERKDLMFLMEVRDRAFHLLLRKTGEVTPLLHAMRIGQSHREVAIVLVGALSRWVNHLEDEEVEKPKTKVLLKALRTNLKLAIDYGLQSSQSDLLASFLQTLIMSEGDKWVWNQISTVGLALRAIPSEGQPVATAEQAVRAFTTRELGKAASIASIEDYIANATADLLMMAAWDVASQTVGGDPIPTYCFARDERVHTIFVARIHEYRDPIFKQCTRRLRWQIKLLETALKGRHLTFRRKVEMLRGELDAGTGPQ